MKLKPILLFTLLLIYSVSIQAQQKIPLNHSVYNDWKSISNQSISNDGRFIAYEINPQEGDGKLFLCDMENESCDSIQRGYKPILSSNSNLLVFNIKPEFDTVRAAKLKKVKKDKLPKDSLGVLIINTGEIIKFAELKSVKIPKKESDWISFLINEPETKKDTLTIDSTLNKKKDKRNKKKDKGDLLVILNPITGDSVSFKNVTKYAFSKNGELCAFVSVAGDSIDSVHVACYNTDKKKYTSVFNKSGFSENITVDELGKQFVFTYSSDTIKEKAFGLYYSNLSKNKLNLISGNDFSNLTDNWSVSKNGKIYFNESGNELYFGTTPKPEPTPKDTLTDDEKVSVDIWNWKDIQLQPQQLKQLEKEKKRSLCCCLFSKGR